LILLRLPFAMLLLVYQSLFLALGQIRTNKLRSVLTTIGIVIGIASVTAVIAALTGLKSKVVNAFETLGTNKMYIQPDVPRTGNMRNINWRKFMLRPEQIDGMLQHCPSLKAVTRVVDAGSTVQFAEHSEENVPVQGIDPDWHIIESRSVTLGRPFTLIDSEQGRAVCLINDKVREKLLLPRDCIGEAITMFGRRYTIVGIVETRTESSMFGNGQSGSEVFVPFRTLWKPGRTNMNMHVVAASRSAELSEEAQAEISFFLRHTRQIRLGQPDTFRIWVVQKELDEFNKIASTMTAIAAGIVSISLLVGGVGIMNIMLVSVSERTREIGLRKAVGARPSAILLQFLVEAVMLCCLGGLFGVLGGEGLTRLIASIPGANLDKAQIPGWAIALSFGFAASVGLIFGMFPAVKAARLDPIEALRHE
jgi:putative ABC transport system permease protein